MVWGGRLASAGLFLFSASICAAEPNKVLYELQERCGKRAAEVFEKDFPDTKTTGVIADYENHYSPRLNKCFIVESSTQYVRDD
jgi:hypothetical protein